MSIKEFAKMLDGREYGHEITKKEEELARELGYVVVFGFSDDNVEFRGALYAEVDAWGGADIALKSGKVMGTITTECNDCPLWSEHIKSSKHIRAKWCDGEFPWTYETDIPHETFNIYEAGTKYCKGIVFEYKEVA